MDNRERISRRGKKIVFVQAVLAVFISLKKPFNPPFKKKKIKL